METSKTLSKVAHIMKEGKEVRKVEYVEVEREKWGFVFYTPDTEVVRVEYKDFDFIWL